MTLNTQDNFFKSQNHGHFAPTFFVEGGKQMPINLKPLNDLKINNNANHNLQQLHQDILMHTPASMASANSNNNNNNMSAGQVYSKKSSSSSLDAANETTVEKSDNKIKLNKILGSTSKASSQGSYFFVLVDVGVNLC